MLTKLKAKVQSAVASQAKAANRIGLSPNMISGIGLGLALLSAINYASGRGNLPYAVVLLLLSGYCDMLDGALARLHGKTTTFGGFLDSMLDRYADAAMYIGLIIGGLCSAPWGLAALVGSLLVSYARARAESAGIKMETIGVAERPERLLTIAAASLVEMVIANALELAVIFLTFLTNLTVFQRSFYAYRTLKKEEEPS
ncbi:CDP-alcohol phosphatidyltransferase family protein [Candidatus Bathyarchaeota archaeon]|nr:CDP-alcohol phosphatidyltransferase family protein [Candidatus Bathyarchaeota archaeon]